MKLRFIYAFLILFFFMFLLSCAMKKPVKINGINIVEFGIYTKTDSGSQVYRDNKESITKIKVNKVTNWKLETKTDIIPRTQRVSFGVTYVVAGHPEGANNIPVIIKIIYPEGPEESILKKHVVGEEHFVGLTFGRHFNYIPGRYGYQFFFKKQKLAEKYFTVYK